MDLEALRSLDRDYVVAVVGRRRYRAAFSIEDAVLRCAERAVPRRFRAEEAAVQAHTGVDHEGGAARITGDRLDGRVVTALRQEDRVARRSAVERDLQGRRGGPRL